MATGGYGDRRQWQRQRHLRRQWWQADTVVTAGYGGEGTSSGNRAENVTLTCAASKNTTAQRFLRRRKGQTALLCTGQGFCAAQPVKPLYLPRRGRMMLCGNVSTRNSASYVWCIMLY